MTNSLAPRPVTHFLAADYRREMPGFFAFIAMAAISASVAIPACHYGIKEIAERHFLTGSAANNYGCYPVQNSMIGVVILGVILLKLLGNRFLDFRKKSPKPLAEPLSTLITIQKKETPGNYWCGPNLVSLHLPRFLGMGSLLVAMGALPWMTLPLDWGVRLLHNDPDAGEQAAAQAGLAASIITPFLLLLMAYAMMMIKNQVYVRHEKEVYEQRNCVQWRDCLTKFGQNLFVDHTRKALPSLMAVVPAEARTTDSSFNL